MDAELEQEIAKELEAEFWSAYKLMEEPTREVQSVSVTDIGLDSYGEDQIDMGAPPSMFCNPEIEITFKDGTKDTFYPENNGGEILWGDLFSEILYEGARRGSRYRRRMRRQHFSVSEGRVLSRGSKRSIFERLKRA